MKHLDYGSQGQQRFLSRANGSEPTGVGSNKMHTRLEVVPQPEGTLIQQPANP